MKKLMMILPVMAFLVLGIFVPKISGDNKGVNMSGAGSAPVYEVTVDTLGGLKEALQYEESTLIHLGADIAISETLTTGNSNYTIVANQDITITRAEGMLDDLFYVTKGSSLTIGQDSSTTNIVIDGNKTLVNNATGSIIDNRGCLNLLKGVSIANVAADVNGAAIYNYGECQIDGATIHDNVIDYAGKYGIIYTTSGSSLLISNAEIYNNSSTYTSGAAIFATTDSYVWISASKLYNNVSGTRGGAINAKACKLTIKNSSLYNNQADYGAAVHSYEGAQLNLSNVKFYNNTSTSVGAAVSIVGATLNATNLNVYENSAEEEGGAIYIIDQTGYAATLYINGGQYTNNTALNTSSTTGHGGAIFVTGDTTVVNIIGAQFDSNQAVYGGAIRINKASAMIVNCDITNNLASNTASSTGLGGGVYAGEGADVKIYSCKIAQNNGVYRGGAVNVASEAVVTMYDSQLYSNISKYGAGVGIEGNAEFVQESGEIMYNISSASGCGVFVDEGSYTLNDGQLSFNKTTGSNGGAINNKDKVYINGGTIEGNSATWYGGAIHSYIGDTSTDVRVVVTGGTFKNNGRLLTIEDDTATVGDPVIYGGGAININSGLLEVSGGTFVGNASAKSSNGKYGFGGAISAQGGQVIISGGAFSENTSAAGGGALYATNAQVTIYNGTFNKNTATASGSTGGAIYLDAIADIATIHNGTFDQNTAASFGGAIYVTNSDLVINNGNFTANYATSGAGAIGVYVTGVVTVNDGSFSGNLATEESDGVRGKDIYVYGVSGGVNDAIAIINGGSYENIGVQYGRASFGGDITITEKAMVWAGVKANYAHFIVHDELTRPITLFNRWDFETGTKSLFLRVSTESKKDPYRLFNNLVIKTSKAKKYYIDYDQASNVATMVSCGYNITVPTPNAINVALGANEGDTVTFTTINGYAISNVKYNDTEIVADNGTYTFTMPASDVAITYDYQLVGLDITVDSEAQGLLSVASTATLESQVVVQLVPSTEWLVTNVYYVYEGETVYLTYRLGKYYFTMFEGVELYVDKTPMYSITFAQDQNLSNDSTITNNGQIVVSALAGETIDVEIVSNNYRYLPDLDNSYYMIEGDDTHYDISTLQFVMPNANVTIYPVFTNIYASLNNVVEVATFEQLKTTLTTNTDADIIIIDDIEINETIQVAPYTTFTIVASGDKTIKRAAGFTKTLFYLPEYSVIKLGLQTIPSGVECSLTIDGNGSVVKNVTGSLFAVINSSELIIYDSVKLTNNKMDKNELIEQYDRISSHAGGSAVMLFNGKLVLNGGEISNNSSKSYGGAIYSYGYVEVNSGKITKNTSTSHGGAIYTNRMVLVNGGEISYNTSTSSDSNAGGIYAASNFLTIVTINGGLFEGNTAKASAGALYIGTRATATINGGEFVNNKSYNGSAGAMYVYGKVVINDGIFRGNSAKANGGAIFVNSNLSETITGEVVLHGGLLEKNSAQFGGAITIAKLGTLYMEESTAVFQNNSASSRGGAIYLLADSDSEPSRAIILQGTFTSNKSSEGKDIAVQYGALEIGGAISVEEIKTVANPTATRGYIKVVKELENEVLINPISYILETVTDQRLLRAASGVDIQNVLQKISLKQTTGTTYYFEYINGEFRFRKKTFLINLNGLEGAISVDPNANSGEVITIATNNGYIVSDIQIEGVQIVDNTFTMPAKDVTITYDASLVDYTLSVAEDISGGTITLDKDTATVVDQVTITIVADKGYYLTQLKVNGYVIDVDTDAITINVDSNTTIDASFARINYMVCYNYNYNGKLDIKTVVAGCVLTETTPTRKGYTFEGWYIDKELTVAYDFSAQVYSVVQLYAKWTQNQ